MDKGEHDQIPILALGIGIIGGAINSQYAFDLWDTMIGVILSLVLLYYRRVTKRDLMSLFIHSLMSGFGLLLVFGFLIEIINPARTFEIPRLSKNISGNDLVFVGVWLLFSMCFGVVTYRRMRDASTH